MVAGWSHQCLFLIKRCTTIKQVHQIHSLMITTGLSRCNFAMSKIIHFCAVSDPKNLEYALSLFNQVTNPTNFIWNTMIRGFSISQNPQKAILIFTKMLQKSLSPDKHTFPFVLRACVNSKQGNVIYTHVLKNGLVHDTFVCNSLIAMYSKCDALDCAYRVFDETPQRDVVTWTALIDGYVRANRATMGLDLFAKMRLVGIEPDEITMVSVLCAIGLVGALRLGRCVHAHFIEPKKVIYDSILGCALLDMYAKCQDIVSARLVFDKMPYGNSIAWSAMITGYIQCGRFKEALDSLQDMHKEGLRPDQAILASVLTGCAQLGALDQGRWIHAYIERNKIDLNLRLGTALIDMYAKCGCIFQAFNVFNSLRNKDVYPWTAMIGGLAMNGSAKVALCLFSKMERVGIRPNSITYIGVLCACSHGGLVEQGKNHFNRMTQVYGIAPKIEHYGCMIDLLGRAGLLKEAMSMIQSMSMEPSAGVWGALFSACMIHKDVELGEIIGKHLIKLQPHHSGRYMLLANLYALDDRWDDVAYIRRLMKTKGVEKIPGCSLIEVNGAIHEFVALDMSHPSFKGIYLMLDAIKMGLRGAGYMPNTIQAFA
ncbi:hypothetical protein AMTRI_Chr09g32570 [Amborella trichopoda]